MPFIPCANTLEVELKFAQEDGEFAENTFGVQGLNPWASGDMVAICNAIAAWWHDGAGGHSYREHQAGGLTLLGVSARDLTTATSARVDADTLPAARDGGSAAPQWQNGLSFALTARTGVAGRSFRGRSFMVGLTNSALLAVGADVIDGVVADQLVTAFNGLIAAVAGVGVDGTLVVISRYHQPGGPGTPTVARTAGVMTAITSYGYHDLFLDYQRRRAPGHNRHH